MKKKMSHAELLDYIVEHPVAAYFTKPWGMKSCFASAFSCIWENLCEMAKDIYYFSSSVISLLFCAFLVLTWPFSKAVMVWHLRRRIMRRTDLEKNVSPKGEYRI